MKAEFESIPYQPGNSFLVRTIKRPYRPELRGAWHYHPEMEICFTLKSKGKRYVGVDIADYTDGDLVLLGPELPHCWITNEETEQIVVQFRPDFLGNDFFQVLEMGAVRRMLHQAVGGLYFSGPQADQAKKRLLQMRDSGPAAGLVLLLDILRLLSEAEAPAKLTTAALQSKTYLMTSQKIGLLYTYVLENLRGDVNLEEASRRSGMCKSTFCNFLRSNTGKTFSEIVNDVRVSHAARLLQESDMTVQEVCYDAGYRDPSYFYRVFQHRMGMPPRQYKIKYAAKT